jgi:two-component system nitrogen regulation response regulator NtrX
VPSLHDRAEDIPLLSHHFIKEICESQGRPALKITEAALTELKKIRWTGNIRELRNVIERLVILCDKQIDGPDVVMYARPLKG